MRASVAAILVLASATLTPGPAGAKEHTAACAALPSMIERLRGALVLAAFHRSRGSSLGAYEALRTTAVNVVRDPGAGACGAVPVVLGRALARARGETTALAASLQLDVGIATALSLALDGGLSGQDTAAKLLDLGESVEYAEGCPDLFRVVNRLTSDDGPPPDLARRVERVVAELRAQGRCAAVIKLLATAREDPAHAVDSLRMDEPDRASDEQNPVARCPELPIVLEKISSTINTGAPLFNKGDHEGCRDLYRQVARSLRDEVVAPGRCPAVRSELDGALTAAAQASTPGEAAWALRHGFDHIAERWQEPSR
jgi:hypothetical protein